MSQVQPLIKDAIISGVKFLKSRQMSNGGFVDFRSTTNPSTLWITAHICWVLEDLPDFQIISKPAVRYLKSHMNPNGSWGFNQTTSGDCGTTAQVLMVFHRHGIKIPEKSIQWLINQQDITGGFPTYPYVPGVPLNSWSFLHADTTLYAMELMKRLRIGLKQGNKVELWLQYQSMKEPLRAFWWKNPSYMLWLQKRLKFNLNLCRRLSEERLLHEPNEIPTLPHFLYGLSYEALLDNKHRFLSIIGKQQLDGSWPCVPYLKVPNPRIRKIVEGRRLFPGNQRIFSTAHTLSTLNYCFQTL